VVSGVVPWSTYFAADTADQEHLNKVDPSLLGKVPLSYFLGTLGMPGMTAYAGIKKIAEPKAGEVAFVSGAAGAVGLVAGQLLKHVYGCKVIGSAGTDDKVALLKEVGFDYAFNYKIKGTEEALAEAAPEGIDVYFDNVGGKVLEDALTAANNHGRIVACGQISQYDVSEDNRYGVKNLWNVVTKRLKMQGFIVSDYFAEMGAEFGQDMAKYVMEGKVVVREKVFNGINNAGSAFVDMMSGGNVGKAVVKVVDQDPYPLAQHPHVC